MGARPNQPHVVTLAILPPEYFPGPEWVSVALRCDVVVLGDTFQYARQSLQNRAKLRTPRGHAWITIPVRRDGFGRPLLDCRADDSRPWRRDHERTVQYNYGSSGYYEHYRETLEHLFRDRACAGNSLVETTIAASRFMMAAMGIRARVLRASELPGSPSALQEVVDAMGSDARPVLTAGQYVRFGARRAGCGRIVLGPRPYRQAFDGFVGGCSVLDLLLCHGPAARDHLLVASILEFPDRETPPNLQAGFDR